MGEQWVLSAGTSGRLSKLSPIERKNGRKKLLLQPPLVCPFITRNSRTVISAALTRIVSDTYTKTGYYSDEDMMEYLI